MFSALFAILYKKNALFFSEVEIIHNNIFPLSFKII